MNLNVTRLMTTCAFAALTMGASLASAEQATFNLPVEARWGNTVLNPGSYRLTVSDSITPVHIFYLRNDTGTKMTVPAIVNYEQVPGKSHLTLVNVSGTYYVREYVSEETGTDARFAIPKSHHHLSADGHVLQIHFVE